MQRQKYVSMDKPQLEYTVVTKYFVEAEILFYGSTSLEMITTEILMRTFWGQTTIEFLLMRPIATY